MATVLVSADRLESFSRSLLVAAGVPEADAACVAECLVDADARDLSSHGVLRLPTYLERLQRGLMPARADIRTLARTPACVHLDAGYALGPLGGVAAMDAALACARQTGLGLSSVKNASHFGAAGYYAARAAREGFVGVAMSNTAAMLVQPGASRPTLGNNPIAVAFPDGRGGVAFVVDTALSQAAFGRIMVARDRGESIPLDWAVDAEGRPTSDPVAALAANALLPMGGGKGFALALAVEALTGLLSGADFGTDVASIYRDLDRPQSLGQTFIAVDPLVFLPRPVLVAAIARLRAMVEAAGQSHRGLPGAHRYGPSGRRSVLRLQADLVARFANLARSLDAPELVCETPREP